MEFLYINEKNIKISLTCEELFRRGLTVELLDGAKPKTRNLLRELLTYADSEIGFEVGTEPITVHLFPSSDGGCELFVTKSGTDLSVSKTDDVGQNRKNDLLFVSESDEALYRLCERLACAGCVGKSTLLCEQKGERRLLLLLHDEKTFPTLSSHAAEYGIVYRIENEEKRHVYEHCHVLCANDAVLKLLNKNVMEK